MANNGDKSGHRKMKRALEAAKSLREDMLRDADQVDLLHRTAKKWQLASTLVSSLANIAVLVSTGVRLPPAVEYATQIGKLAVRGLAWATVSEPDHSFWEKYYLDPRWQEVCLMLDNPNDMKGGDFKKSKKFISLMKDAAVKAGPTVIQFLSKDQMTTQAKTASAKGIFRAAVPLVFDIYNLVTLSTDLYYATPSVTAVFLREWAESLGKLIEKYEKMS